MVQIKKQQRVLAMTPEILTMMYIFFARVMDVSIGTVRIILISRGYRYIAPLLGFIEILIWLAAISTALKNLNNFLSYIIYAAGFATGNYVGMLLEELIAIGHQSLRIVTTKNVTALPLILREEGFGVTVFEGQGKEGDVLLIYTVVPKREVKKVIKMIETLEPNGFITIEDVKSFHNGFLGKRNFFEIFGRQIAKKK